MAVVYTKFLTIFRFAPADFTAVALSLLHDLEGFGVQLILVPDAGAMARYFAAFGLIPLDRPFDATGLAIGGEAMLGANTLVELVQRTPLLTAWATAGDDFARLCAVAPSAFLPERRRRQRVGGRFALTDNSRFVAGRESGSVVKVGTFHWHGTN